MNPPHPIPASQNIYESFKQWKERYIELMNDYNPTSSTLKCFNHTTTLLPILTAISELHPAAKATVAAFLAIVGIEKERRENDGRVRTVIIAQTDMMLVILEILSITTGDYHLNETSILPIRLQDIRFDLNECGNAIDTYYKEKRLIKFLKATQWKETLLGYIERFDKHKQSLHQAISFQTAFQINNIATSMTSQFKTAISTFFSQRSGWEDKVQSRIQELGPRFDTWVKDQNNLWQLVVLTEEPSLNMDSQSNDNTDARDGEYRQIFMKSLEADIKSSVGTLIRRNMEYFHNKSSLQIERLQEKIVSSAEYIMRNIPEGPHSRLHHPDLQELWKEMRWLFCVDSTTFAIALKEFYLDRFHHLEAMHPLRGSYKHPDSWTLEFLSLDSHRQELIRIIDTDKSGFVRISEVNAFTDGMPKDWSFPVYCAYCVVGWKYETLFYQERMSNLLEYLVHENMRVLSENRPYMATILNTDTFTHLGRLSRGSIFLESELNNSHLLELSNKRMAYRHESLKKDLSTLKYHIDTEDTIRLLMGNEPLENYILCLCNLLFEHWLWIARLCASQVLHVYEFCDMWSSILVVGQAVDSRIVELEVDWTTSNLDIEQQFQTYRGGIFRLYKEDVDTREVLQAFDISRRLGLLYKTLHIGWEQLSAQECTCHPKSSASLSRFEDSPKQINKRASRFSFLPVEERSQPFPFFADYWCDQCEMKPLTGRSCFTCTVCLNIDVCAQCQLRGEVDIIGHSSDHAMVQHVMYFPFTYRDWIVGLGRYLEAMFRSQYASEPIQVPIDDGEKNQSPSESSDTASNGPENQPSSPEDGSPISERFPGLPEEIPLSVCEICHTALQQDQKVFLCMELRCSINYICLKCHEETSGKDTLNPREPVDITFDNQSHEWWHSVLIIPPRPKLPLGSNPTSAHSPTVIRSPAYSETEGEVKVGVMSSGTTAQKSVPISVESSIAAMEERLSALETTVGEVKDMLSRLLGHYESLTPKKPLDNAES